MYRQVPISGFCKYLITDLLILGVNDHMYFMVCPSFVLYESVFDVWIRIRK